MRKVAKFLFLAFVAVAALLVVAVGVIYAVSSSKLHKQYTVAIAPNALAGVEGSVARGEHLAATRGCLDCHGPDLGGAKVVENPAMGRWFAPNLTRGEGGVTAGYSDEDWERSIRHGVNPKGRGLFLMPSYEYAAWSQQDLADVVAFAKSAPPVNRATTPVSLGPISRMLVATGKMRLAADIIDHSGVKPATVTPAATADYGRYLAVGCTGCHGENFSGGKIAIGPPDWPPAANLTGHPQGALASWTEADFVNAIRTGQRPNGTAINPVMPRAFGKMNDDELKALWSFLKTVPAAPTGVR